MIVSAGPSPWTDLAAGARLVPPPLVAGQSPCAGCYSPCCWVVQLTSQVPHTLQDLDFLRFCAGFERIEIGINASGSFVVNYRAPCRHLTAELGCELHGTPSKPLVCQRYDEHSCMYREAFQGPASSSYLRLDLRRMDVLMSRVTFDGDGVVRDVPARDELLRAFLEAEAREPEARPLPGSVVPIERLALGVRWDRRAGRPTARLPHPQDEVLDWHQARTSPCVRCCAPCCQVLVFEHGTPSNVNAVDFMEYTLGFPGIELALTRSGWKTLVHTTCRHFDLEQGACGIWGRPERPLICGTYDAHKCAYRSWLIEPQTAPFLRVDHDTFQRVRRHFTYGEGGEVAVNLTVEQLQAVLDVVAPRSELPLAEGA